MSCMENSTLIEEIKKYIKDITVESAKDLKFLNAKECAKIIHKNPEDMRKLMRTERISCSS